MIASTIINLIILSGAFIFYFKIRKERKEIMLKWDEIITKSKPVSKRVCERVNEEFEAREVLAKLGFTHINFSIYNLTMESGKLFEVSLAGGNPLSFIIIAEGHHVCVAKGASEFEVIATRIIENNYIRTTDVCRKDADLSYLFV